MLNRLQTLESSHEEVNLIQRFIHWFKYLESMWKYCLKTILGCNGAAIIKGFRFGPATFLSASSGSFSACDPLGKNPGEAPRLLANIPEVKLLDVLGNRRSSIQITLQNYEPGMLPSEHAIALAAIAVAENPKEAFEIGTFCGHTTKLLAQNLRNASIHTIDLPPDFYPDRDSRQTIPKDDFHLIRQRSVGREYKNQIGSERIIQHYGDTAHWDFSLIRNASFFSPMDHIPMNIVKMTRKSVINSAMAGALFYGTTVISTIWGPEISQ